VVRLRTAADEGFKVTNATAVLRTMSLIAEQRFRPRLHPAGQAAGPDRSQLSAVATSAHTSPAAPVAGRTIYGFVIGVAWK
jgi:hypothetical protein